MEHLNGKTYIDVHGREYRVLGVDMEVQSLVWVIDTADGTTHCQQGSMVEQRMIEQGLFEKVTLAGASDRVGIVLSVSASNTVYVKWISFNEGDPLNNTQERVYPYRLHELRIL